MYSVQKRTANYRPAVYCQSLSANLTMGLYELKKEGCL